MQAQSVVQPPRVVRRFAQAFTMGVRQARATLIGVWYVLVVGILVAFSPGWPRGVIDSESLNKVLTSLDSEWHNLNANKKSLQV